MVTKETGSPKVMSVEETRLYLDGKLGRSALYNAIRRSEIPSVRIGRRILIPVAALDRWLETGQAGHGSAAVKEDKSA